MTVYSLPEAMDWNEDSLIDLIHCGKNGGYSDPNILLYINEGTKTNYKFGTPVNIMSNGSPMYHVSPPTPHVIDYNKDGKKDLMIGTSNGKIAYYENEGANNSPVFGSPVYLQHGPQDNDEIFVPKTWEGSSSPEAKEHFCDWNKDGYWDIILGGGKSVMDLTIAYGKKPTPLNKEAVKSSFSHPVSIIIRNNMLIFINKSSNEIELSIYNANGSKVFNKEITDNNKTTELKHEYPKGVYFIKTTGNNITCTKKIIIK